MQEPSQRELFTRRTATPAVRAQPTPRRRDNHEAPMWLQRLSLVLLVAVCVYLGLWLVVLPWTSLWNDNPILMRLPVRIAEWLHTGLVRGLVSGIGLLDIWIGINEISAFQLRRKREIPSHE